MEENPRLGMSLFVAGLLIAGYLLAGFAVFPVSAAVDYTGSVTTTDAAGVPKDTFFRGEPVYMDIELKYDGVPTDSEVLIEFIRAEDGALVDSTYKITDDPVIGWYNSSDAAPTFSFNTFVWVPGDFAIYDVVVIESWTWTQIGVASVIILNTGLWMEPWPMLGYYPEEVVNIRMVTEHTTDVFYAEIVNDTGVTKVNWTGQVALEGYWNVEWTIPTDFADGNYVLRVRDAGTHAIWMTNWFTVQEFIIATSTDRSNYLAGESARISYSVLSIRTLEVQASVEVNYSVEWLNNTGGVEWENGTTAGGQGTHEVSIPADIATYSDVIIAYWIEQTPGVRSAETYVWLYLEMLDADVWIDSETFVPGNTITVSVQAFAGWNELPGAVVDIEVSKSGTAIAAYGATGLTTDSFGMIRHSFQLDADEDQGTFLVTAIVSKVGQSVTRMTLFEVQWNGGITVEFDKARYYAGDTVTATFQVHWNSEYLTGAAVTYLVGTDLGILVIGNTTTGSVSFALPSGYYGFVWMEAVVNIDGYMLVNIAMAEVVLADVMVAAVTGSYDALDTIEFDYEVVSIAAGANLKYEIVDPLGVTVANSSLPLAESGTISFTVPPAPASSYTCVVTLSTSGGLAISDYDTAYRSEEYELEIQVQPSSHMLGSFEPGETTVVEYTILKHGLPSLPVYELVISTTWGDDVTIITTDTAGNISLPISEDASSGWAWIAVSLYDASSDAYLTSDQAMISIDAAAGEWDLVIEGLEEDIALLSQQISDQGNVTSATLADMWDEINATQAAIDVLMDSLQATQDDVNAGNANIELIMADLEAMDAQLEALQTQLEALQEDMTAMEDDVSARPTGSSVAMWLAIAVVVLIIAGVAIAFVMKRKT